jgi:hypothetical protein
MLNSVRDNVIYSNYFVTRAAASEWRVEFSSCIYIKKSMYGEMIALKLRVTTATNFNYLSMALQPFWTLAAFSVS